jgi:hypothetical protein
MKKYAESEAGLKTLFPATPAEFPLDSRAGGSLVSL